MTATEQNCSALDDKIIVPFYVGFNGIMLNQQGISLGISVLVYI